MFSRCRLIDCLNVAKASLLSCQCIKIKGYEITPLTEIQSYALKHGNTSNLDERQQKWLVDPIQIIP